MELLKHIQDMIKESEKEWTDIFMKRIWQRHGPVKRVEHKTGENGMPYTVVTRGEP